VLSIGVFGSSLPPEGSEPYEQARTVGRAIARAGARVVCGGYAGVMEAVCRGAAEEGGRGLGILLAGRGDPNAWVTDALVCRDRGERLARLRDASDGWIFLPRGLGTMLELAWIAESVVKADLAPRPLVLLGEFWRPVVEMARAESSTPEGRTALDSCLCFAASASEAVRLAMPRARGFSSRRPGPGA
jgi:uncharacterized protein (TIGR00725 family)